MQKSKPLVAAVKLLWANHAAHILKSEDETRKRWRSILRGEERFWLWNAILQSSATNGGSRHGDSLTFLRTEFVRRTTVDPFGWEHVTTYNADALGDWLGLAANPHFQRWGRIKGHLIEFVATYRDNGLNDLTNKIIDSDRGVCLTTMTAVPGVSHKYARNLLMDVGHPEFMDGSFAFDSRIERFLRNTTGAGHTYGKSSSVKWTEAQLVHVAHDAGLTAWQMDRLIYLFGGASLSFDFRE